MNHRLHRFHRFGGGSEKLSRWSFRPQRRSYATPNSFSLPSVKSVQSVVKDFRKLDRHYRIDVAAICPDSIIAFSRWFRRYVFPNSWNRSFSIRRNKA
jgi:hypothetical protein